MNVSDVTTKMLDTAIHWQMRAPQDDRDKFTERAYESKQFMEYLVFCVGAIVAGNDIRCVVASALTIGIEIGMALEQVNRRPNA